ncbi:MAG: peptidoglycan DD-metalloendopeptidase family protein [Gammaproteobacteria bacterium]|nr:peptidoglycan DD-metalloendopeptidase family protein [Gammaproteobacteria bacterium]
MNCLARHLILLLSVALLVSCISPRAVNQRIASKGSYLVKPSDTLYSIAWRYGLDNKVLARWNQIDVNSTIYPGQQLILIEPERTGTQTIPVTQTVSTVSVPSPQSKTTKPATSMAGSSPKHWLWPTSGKLLNTFSAQKLDRRGIDIGGKLGQAIHAVADGRVVYSGNGLAGYGNLIIIKHSDTYLSAYAYSQERLVSEGVKVKAGMKIAEMGQHKTRTARLHFQIRKNGKPVNPLKFLPKR